MKIRNGFVSNSSSSSFIVIGDHIDFSDISDALDNGKEIYALGKWLYEGQDFFPVQKNMIGYISKLPERTFNFLEVFKMFEEEGSIEKSDFGKNKKVKIMSVEADYHSSDTLKELKENYMGNMYDEN